VSPPDSQNRRGHVPAKSLEEFAGFIASILLTKSGQIDERRGREGEDQRRPRRSKKEILRRGDGGGTLGTTLERQIACTRGKWDWFLSGSRAPAGWSGGCGLRGHGFMFNAESVAIARDARLYSYMREEPRERERERERESERAKERSGKS